MTTLTLREYLCASLAFCAGLILLSLVKRVGAMRMSYLTLRECAALAFAAALVKRPCPPSPCPPHARPPAPALDADLEINLDTDADASGDRYGEYYR